MISYCAYFVCGYTLAICFLYVVAGLVHKFNTTLIPYNNQMAEVRKRITACQRTLEKNHRTQQSISSKTIEMKILDVSAKTISAPYKICSNANFKIKSLIGETIGPGWKNKINKLIGNIEGCTHVRELLVSMATVSFQTVYGEKSKRTREAINKGEKNPYPIGISRPSLLNTCYAFDERSEVTKKQWPEYWKKS